MNPIPFIDLKTQLEALRGPIEQRIQNVLNHCQFILGPEVTELENQLADFVGCKHAITCSSGTDAAIMAMMALGIGPGDEVIVPAFSFIATAESVVLLGATPVYVDIDPETYNLDVHQLEQALSPKTKAIQPVSLYGQPADMNAINNFAKQHRLYVIEDAAQSFGATYEGQKSCALSDFGITSFFPAKPLGGFGDGGCIFTNRDDWAEALQEIRVHGQKSRYFHTRIGINGRLDTLQCAILLPKLERFPWELEQRQKIATYYNDRFATLTSRHVHLPKVAAGRTSAWAQYTLAVPQRTALQEELQKLGVPTSIHYPMTMSEQPAYLENGRVVSDEKARSLAKRVISLPLYPDMPEEVMTAVADRVLLAFEKLS